MASLHSYRAVFTICVAIALAGHVLLASVEATTSNRPVFDATSPDPNHGVNHTTIESSMKNLTRITMNQIKKAAPDFSTSGEIGKLINPSNGLGLSALRSCQELLNLALDNLNKSLSPASVMGQGSLITSQCAAGATLHTCIDGFEDQPLEVRELVSRKLKDALSLNGESTALTALLDRAVSPTDQSDLLGQDYGYPEWMPDSDRNLLGDSKVTANVVVAQDGSGNYKRIADAVNAAPRFSKNRFVIYVKAGSYRENVRIGNDKTNLMMIGDGMDKTIIYSNLSYGGGYQTWDSATFAVQGEGFIGRDLRFTNTAGAANMQAVALLSASDRSVFYRCRIDGYQDSLYAHSNRQLYRECQIYGTIDFIFGGAAAVVQRSGIRLRQPLRGQQNAITAPYRTSPQCPTALVVHRSAVVAAGDLRGVASYLGRPWTPYAAAVFMENSLDGLIDAKGWLPWDPVKMPVPPDTVFLAEYENKGAGARTEGRVTWKGVRRSIGRDVASFYTVGSFIQGNQWLPATQIPYESGI